MSINPFTKLPYSSSTPNVLPVLSLLGNVRGVVNYDSSANTTLYVNGDAAINGVCHIKQLRIGGPESVLSDERCKNNFWHIENPFYALDRIQGYTFDYLHDGSSSMGFKAQEVEALFPFLVEQHDGTKYVAYQPLIACAWEALKLLNSKVKDLQQRLATISTIATIPTIPTKSDHAQQTGQPNQSNQPHPPAHEPTPTSHALPAMPTMPTTTSVRGLPGLPGVHGVHGKKHGQLRPVRLGIATPCLGKQLARKAIHLVCQ